MEEIEYLEEDNRDKESLIDVNLVVYTDGSFKDSYSGSALFGYIYKVTDIDAKAKNLPKDVVPTTHGFMSHELLIQNKALYSKAKDVIPCAYVLSKDGGGINKDIEVNSAYAEAYTMMLLQMILGKIKRETNYNVKDILIKTDSQMLIYVLTSIKENNGIDRYAYYSIYKPLNDVIRKHIDSGNTFNFYHVKGHTNCLGNEIVDKLANYAREALEEQMSITDSSKRDFSKVNSLKIYPTCENKSREDTFWRKRVELLKGTYGDKLYYVPDECNDYNTFYHIKTIKDKEPAERDPSSLTGIILTDKKEDTVSKVINKQLDYLNLNKDYFASSKLPSSGVMYALDALNIVDPLGNLFLEVDCDCIKRTMVGDIYLGLVNKLTVSSVVRPGFLGAQLIRSLDDYRDIIERFYKNEETIKMLPGCKVEYIDITDIFFSRDKKDRIKLILDHKKNTDFINVKSTIFNREVRVTTMQGVDVPRRNFFKSLEECIDVKLYICIVKRTDISFDYSLIVDATFENNVKSCSMWFNKNANVGYIKTKNKE